MAVKLIPESIREVLEYRPDTGDFVCTVARNSRTPIGSKAGSTNRLGYLVIGYQGAQFLGHRVAYFLMTGEQPPEKIDHRDRDPRNNRWNNLRPSGNVHNSLNRGYQQSRLCGVSLKKGKYWAAWIATGNKKTHLYWGKDFFEACCARKSAENQHYRPLLEDE